MQNLTFVQYLLAHDLSINTVKEYQTVHAAVLRECPNLSEDEIAKFYGSKKSHATKLFYFYFLKHLGAYLHKDLNKGLTYLRPHRTRDIRFIQENQLRTLFESAPLPFEKKYKALFLLITATGLRVSEALRIRGEDFATVLTVRGKGDQDRQIYVDPSAQAQIIDLIHPAAEGLLFDFTRNTAYIGMRKWAARLGIHLTPHMLRHTFATYLLNSGANLEFIRDVLGHSSLETTQRYVSMDPAKKLAIYMETNPIGRLCLNRFSREQKPPKIEISALRGCKSLRPYQTPALEPLEAYKTPGGQP